MKRATHFVLSVTLIVLPSNAGRPATAHLPARPPQSAHRAASTPRAPVSDDAPGTAGAAALGTEPGGAAHRTSPQIPIPIPIPIPFFQSDAKKISKKGPIFPAEFNLSDFKFKAFVTGGWPLFFDYELERPGRVTLTIKVKKSKPFVYEFRGTSAGRHAETITLPPHLGGKPVVASYSFKAVGDNTPDAALVPLDVHALAVGEAVGSSGIAEINFHPPDVQIIQGRPATAAAYSFRALRPFSGGMQADFRRVLGSKTRSVGKQSHRRPIARGEKVEGVWDCRKGGSPSLGRHRLFVRAWYTLQSSGSFAVGNSTQSVLVRP